MNVENFEEPRVDRTIFSVASLYDESDEKAYWHSRTPHERLEHLELLRWINYGPQATERLQRVLEIAERESSHPKKKIKSARKAAKAQRTRKAFLCGTFAPLRESLYCATRIF